MKSKPFDNLRRTLAMLLALALFASLPVLAEEVPVTLDDAPELAALEADDLSIDALPELDDALALEDGDLSLSDGIDQSLEAPESDGDAVNTSKPMPELVAYTYTRIVKEDTSFKMNIQDDLVLVTTDADIALWENSNYKVATITRLAPNKLFVKPTSKGVVTITLKLTNGGQYKYTLTLEDGYALKKLSLSKKSMTLLVGQDVDMKQLYVLEPVYADAEIYYVTSDNNVAAMSDDCVVTAMKPGKATITAVADKTLKASMEVTVKANRTDVLSDKPTAKEIGKLVKKWTLWPKSVELKGNGNVVCELWLLNDCVGKLTALKNLDLAISAKDDTGNTLIARYEFKSVKVNCAENKYKTVTVTFPAKSVNCPQAFPDLKAKDLSFRLYGTPYATNSGKVKISAYLPTAIPCDVDATKNPVKYRALLVSESQFYDSHEKDPNKRWERIPRNRNNVTMVKKMLQNVKTPDGSKYEITTEDNTTLNQLRQLIKNTYAGADANDVSLFFIASHGDSDDDTTGAAAGAIVMASLEEKDSEFMKLEELRDLLLAVPGKVIVILQSCGSGAAIYRENGGNSAWAMAQAAEAFDAQVVNVFRSADPGVMEPDYAANTGELRKVNKFYVLTATTYHEESWSTFDHAYFVEKLIKAVGESGKMPADTQFAGNKNGTVDLHELYRYISGVFDRDPIESEKKIYFQHVQVYPSDLRFPLFK